MIGGLGEICDIGKEHRQFLPAGGELDLLAAGEIGFINLRRKVFSQLVGQPLQGIGLLRQLRFAPFQLGDVRVDGNKSAVMGGPFAGLHPNTVGEMNFDRRAKLLPPLVTMFYELLRRTFDIGKHARFERGGQIIQVIGARHHQIGDFLSVGINIELSVGVVAQDNPPFLVEYDETFPYRHHRIRELPPRGLQFAL